MCLILLANPLYRDNSLKYAIYYIVRKITEIEEVAMVLMKIIKKFCSKIQKIITFIS